MLPCSTASRAFCRFGTRGLGLVRRFWGAALVFALALIAAFVMRPTTVHFELTGVDWNKVSRGYRGISPEKSYMQLEIPRKYLDTTVVPFLFLQSISRNIGLYGPSVKRRGSILIRFYYPSMNSAPLSSSDSHVGVMLGAQEGSRRVVNKEYMLPHKAIRDPQADVAGLCGYNDPIDVGWKGNEFYLPCRPTKDIYIYCNPPYGNRRLCIEYLFLGQNISASVFFQHKILIHHEDIAEQIRKLVFSFIR